MAAFMAATKEAQKAGVAHAKGQRAAELSGQEAELR
jgi:hypothetical protein